MDVDDISQARYIVPGMGGTLGKMGQLLISRFEQSGLSIKQLADKSGVPYGAVYPIVKGKRDPQLSTVERLCDVLNLELTPKRVRKQRM